MHQDALRLVVADNDVDALDLAVTDLTHEGHEVVAACLDGDSALAAVRETNPDVLVIDFRMPPGLSGLEVAQKLHEEQWPGRVVVYSNYQSSDLITSTRATGATFLPKGNLRSLRRVVRG